MEAHNLSPSIRPVFSPLGPLQQRVPSNQLKQAATVTWPGVTARGMGGRPWLQRLLEWNLWATGKGERKEELPTCCVCVCFVLVVTAGTRQPELTPLTSALHCGISSRNTRKCVWSVWQEHYCRQSMVPGFIPASLFTFSVTSPAGMRILSSNSATMLWIINKNRKNYIRT